MTKLGLVIPVLLLAGCASTSEWRTLSIDSSSEAAFETTVYQLSGELPSMKQQLFALALVDIARTGLQQAEDAEPSAESAYTNEDFRADLNGLTYDDVIALADRSGVSVKRQYAVYRASRTNGFAAASMNSSATGNRTDGNGEGMFWPGQNSGSILSDAWKEPGFSASDFQFP